ncbi:Hsp70 family protein [Spirillospora sp. NPDC052242]
MEPLRPDDPRTIADFRIEGLLGEGGMGRVYLGRSPGGRRVAVKVVRSEYAADPAFRRRFAREIAAMRRVPGIFTAPVMSADAGGSPPWLATAYIEGASLHERVRADGPLPARELLDLAVALAEAMSAIHAEGLTHRDLKPSNVLLAADGPKVIDFGLAVTPDATLLTGAHPIGTPAYMSPEQCRGGRVEQPSDVFSFGGLLVYAATGRGPFGTGAAHVLVHRVLHGEPRLGELAGPLREIVSECLRHDPAARPTAPVLLARLSALTEADAPGTTGADPHDTRAYTRPFGTAKRRAIGIDLGSRTSTICVLDGGRPTVIADAHGLRGTPSVVAFAPDGTLLVGRAAEQQAILHPERTVRWAVREMDAPQKRGIGGADFVPQQIGAFVLRKLKSDAEARLGEPVTDAVLTVPARLSESGRRAVTEAGRIAGLNVLRLIPAPSAVACGLALRPDDATVVVFDLGGGTLDVALLNVGDGVVETLAVSGDGRLGGDDWDARIVAWLVERFERATGVDLSRDATAPARLREAAERAKIALSSAPETRISLPHIARAAGPLHLDEPLTRAEFQRMTADLLDRAAKPFHQVLEDAGLAVSDIDEVVLAGGATRMPAVAELIRGLTGGREPDRSVNPDEGAAAGASLHAGVLVGEVADVLLMDVATVSLGIERADGGFTKIIERNTSIPTKRSEAVASLPAGGRPGTVEVRAYQGERETAASNRRLGTLELGGPPADAPDVPWAEVCFDVDANGIVHVSAENLVTGERRSMPATPESALPEEDIARMTREAERMPYAFTSHETR